MSLALAARATARRTERRSSVKISALGDEWLSQYFGRRTSAGVVVDEAALLSVPAVLSAVCTTADAIAMVPKPIFRRLDEERKARDRDHPLDWVLNHAWNPNTSAFDGCKMHVLNRLIRGRSYQQTMRNGRRQAGELWQLSPHRVTPKLEGRRLWFEVHTDSGQLVRVSRERMFQQQGFRLDGWEGTSHFALCDDTIGTAKAMERYKGEHFQNGGASRMALLTDDRLDAEQKDNIGNSFLDAYADPDYISVPVLDHGIKAQNIGVDLEKSQLKDTTLGQLQDIARIAQIQPARIGDHSNSTLANVEQQAIEFVQFTVASLVKEMESAINLQLLLGGEQRTHFAEFNLDGLVRGDLETRYRAYSTAITSGFMTGNEVRRKENLEPLEGLDEPLQPLNMTTPGERDEQKDAA